MLDSMTSVESPRPETACVAEKLDDRFYPVRLLPSCDGVDRGSPPVGHRC